ncbi:hypothetical protein EDD21DRAFT_70456 [Dissophora ornata]|nr:hypothetical protein EDD21DRAFT_70456 [Dissophora ornata]
MGTEVFCFSLSFLPLGSVCTASETQVQGKDGGDKSSKEGERIAEEDVEGYGWMDKRMVMRREIGDEEMRCVKGDQKRGLKYKRRDNASHDWPTARKAAAGATHSGQLESSESEDKVVK